MLKPNHEKSNLRWITAVGVVAVIIVVVAIILRSRVIASPTVERGAFLPPTRRWVPHLQK